MEELVQRAFSVLQLSKAKPEKMKAVKESYSMMFSYSCLQATDREFVFRVCR